MNVDKKTSFIPSSSNLGAAGEELLWRSIVSLMIKVNLGFEGYQKLSSLIISSNLIYQMKVFHGIIQS